MRPTPRLKNIQPTQQCTLVGETKPRTLVAKCDKYGYFDRAVVALSHPVTADNMTFGDGQGWHVKESEQ